MSRMISALQCKCSTRKPNVSSEPKNTTFYRAVFDLVRKTKTKNQGNYSGISIQTQITQSTNLNSRQIHVTDPKLGKTRASKLGLVLVVLLDPVPGKPISANRLSRNRGLISRESCFACLESFTSSVVRAPDRCRREVMGSIPVGAFRGNVGDSVSDDFFLVPHL